MALASGPLRDHLGSTAVVVSEAGAVLWRDLYLPYGDVRHTWRSGTTALQTGYRYTGQRMEVGVGAPSPVGGLDRGLYDYGARWYDPAIGRFLAPDTIVPDPGHPQALNRYMYVLGNPLRYTDPTGHREVPPPIPIPPWYYPIIPFLEDWGLLNPMAPYYLVPTALGVREKQRAAATGEQVSEALVLTADWYFEQGQEVREFGPESQITQALIRDEGVARARQAYMEGGNRDTQMRYNFGLRDAAREFRDVIERGDWSTSFLGGYEVQIKTVGVETRHTIAEFTVTNRTGWQSATRVWSFSFKQNEPRSDPGPGGTMTQYYRWLERIPRRTNSSQRGILAQ